MERKIKQFGSLAVYQLSNGAFVIRTKDGRTLYTTYNLKDAIYQCQYCKKQMDYVKSMGKRNRQ